MHMAEFVVAARVGQLQDPGKMLVEVDGRMVVLFLVQGRYSCIDDVCTHDGGPLGDGQLCGTSIACPRHGARFDICSGRPLSMPATEATLVHEVKVAGDQILVRLQDE
jgi:3-phenylpropionate/trans-cinnamate dioxygenase ferredoxin subunit